MSEPNRRTYLAGVAGLGTLTIAGCVEADDEGEEEEEEEEEVVDDQDGFQPQRDGSHE